MSDEFQRWLQQLSIDALVNGGVSHQYATSRDWEVVSVPVGITDQLTGEFIIIKPPRRVKPHELPEDRSSGWSAYAN